MVYKTKASHSTSLQAGAVGQTGSESKDGSQTPLYHSTVRGETLFVNDGHRRVAAGTYDPEAREFTKCVKANQILRTPPGIAIQSSLLHELKRRGCVRVVVHLKGEGRTLRAPLVAFERFGITLDRGYGAQVALALERWTDAAFARRSPSLWEDM